MRETINRTGEINYNNYGSKMTIIEYNNSSDITVEFNNGYKTKNTYYQFKLGNVYNPYDKSLCNIGYVGIGKYSLKTNNNLYTKWKNMIKRCYDEKERYKNPTYIRCSVCEEWHNFQNFAQWYNDNYYEIEGERMALDKDILVKGNKIYSPDTCIFVPHDINMLFVKCDKSRGEYPIGVSLIKRDNLFISSCNKTVNKTKTHIYLGRYITPKQAFDAYKEYKENHIKEVADYYKNQIPDKLYKAMYNWIVEITD
jgi:hypothetical protein